MRIRHFVAGLGLLTQFAAALPGHAEALKVAIPQKGNWDTGIVDYANLAGMFKPEGLEVETVYTQGGSQTIQAVISGSVDIAMGTGTLGVIGAFSKGAPVRILSAEMTGASDLFWYVKADSPVHTLKDATGKTVAFSEAGSSSNLVLLGLLQQFGASAKPIAVGGVPNSLTQVMSGQIDVGWSAAPFNLQDVKAGTLRIVARGAESDTFRNETVRVNFTTATTLAAKADAIARFNRVYAKALVWAYHEPQAVGYFATATNLPIEVAKQARDEFLPEAAMQPNEVRGQDLLLKQAADYKFTGKQMTQADLAPLLADMAKPAPKAVN
jgi:NitT/TauT family transport system substrate-binding protein